MGDRSQCKVTLYGVAGHEAMLVDLFADWQTEWGTYGPPDLAHFTEGCEVMDDERSIGTLWDSDVWNPLEELGISYWAEQDAKYEYPGVERMFTPELGVFLEDSLGDAGVAISGYTLDKIVDRARETYRDGSNDREGLPERLMDLFSELNRMTGRAHRERMHELEKAAHPEFG